MKVFPRYMNAPGSSGSGPAFSTRAPLLPRLPSGAKPEAGAGAEAEAEDIVQAEEIVRPAADKSMVDDSADIHPMTETSPLLLLSWPLWLLVLTTAPVVVVSSSTPSSSLDDLFPDESLLPPPPPFSGCRRRSSSSPPRPGPLPPPPPPPESIAVPIERCCLGVCRLALATTLQEAASGGDTKVRLVPVRLITIIRFTTPVVPIG